MFNQATEQWVDPAHRVAIDCLSAGVERAQPQRVVNRTVQVENGFLTIEGTRYDLDDYENVYVIGGGNAAGHVAATVESELDDAITDGVVVTDDPVDTQVVDVVEGDHPIPSERGVRQTHRIRQIATDATEDDLLLMIVAGGGSALMTAPAGSLSLDDVQETTDSLLRCGATIDEINAVRKHLSSIKGGRLAAAATPATVAGLVFSDVVGDDTTTVASGPTAPDETTFEDAQHVINTYDIDVTEAVSQHLAAGADRPELETPGAESPAFETVTNHVLVTGLDAVRGAASYAESVGLATMVLSSRIRGEAQEAALSHLGVIEEVLASGHPINPPAVIVSGGETTVTVRGDGTGGPNLEFALSAALEIPDDAVVASIDTDGIDGATDIAGAIVDAETVHDGRRARSALDNNDAYSYLHDRDRLLVSGPTGTNVNDLRVAVVGDVTSLRTDDKDV